MSFSKMKPVALFCPNCGHKVVGYHDEDGAVRLICDRCKSVMFSKFHPKKCEVAIKVQVRHGEN